MGELGGAREHVLFFHDVSGAAQVERHPSLADAVRRIEALANDDGVTDCELFGLDPVRLQRQQRWHVAVASAPGGGSGPAADAELPTPRQAPPAPPAAPAGVPAAVSAQPVPDHLDALDVEIVDEVFHDVVRDVVRDGVGGGVGGGLHDGAEGAAAETHESADVLPSAPRGRGLGFFVHQ